MDGGEGVEDCEGAFGGVGAGVGEDLLEGWVAVVEGDVGCVGCDEGLEGCEVGGVGEEGSDDFGGGGRHVQSLMEMVCYELPARLMDVAG